jgi:hypothetical protein
MMLRGDGMSVAIRCGARRCGAVCGLAVLAAVGLAMAGCYERTISRSGIGSHGAGRVYEPNVEDPDAPLFPWFGGDDEKDER